MQEEANPSTSVTMPLTCFHRETRKVARNFNSGKWHTVFITRHGKNDLVALSPAEHQRMVDVEERFENALENCF